MSLCVSAGLERGGERKNCFSLQKKGGKFGLAGLGGDEAAPSEGWEVMDGIKSPWM